MLTPMVYIYIFFFFFFFFFNLDLNFCTNHHPCKNGGSCFNSGHGSYNCKCPPNFTGKNCEIELNACDQEPCQNGGTCRVSRVLLVFTSLT